MIGFLVKNPLKIVLLLLSLWSFSAAAVETHVGSSITISVNKALGIEDNQDLFGVKNNGKLNESYGVSLSLMQMIESGFEFGGEIGYRTDNQKNKNSFLGQLGFTFDKLSMENKMWTLLAKSNYYFDNREGFLKPYIGLGIGAAKTNFSFEGSGKRSDGSAFGPKNHPDAVKKIKLAYQIDTGIAFDISPNLLGGVGIQYFGLSDVTKNDFESEDLAAHTIGDGKIKTGQISAKLFLKLFI